MPSWRPSCAASARAARNGIVSSARPRCRVECAARIASSRKPGLEHDRRRVGARTSNPTQRRSRAALVGAAGVRSRVAHAGVRNSGSTRGRASGRLELLSLHGRRCPPVAGSLGVRSRFVHAFLVAAAPLAVRVEPALRARPLAHVRPGHLDQPGVVPALCAPTSVSGISHPLAGPLRPAARRRRGRARLGSRRGRPAEQEAASARACRGARAEARRRRSGARTPLGSACGRWAWSSGGPGVCDLRRSR